MIGSKADTPGAAGLCSLIMGPVMGANANSD
jgi:hypothetical protein